MSDKKQTEGQCRFCARVHDAWRCPDLEAWHQNRKAGSTPAPGDAPLSVQWLRDRVRMDIIAATKEATRRQ